MVHDDDESSNDCFIEGACVMSTQFRNKLRKFQARSPQAPYVDFLATPPGLNLESEEMWKYFVGRIMNNATLLDKLKLDIKSREKNVKSALQKLIKEWITKRSIETQKNLSGIEGKIVGSIVSYFRQLDDFGLKHPRPIQARVTQVDYARAPSGFDSSSERLWDELFLLMTNDGKAFRDRNARDAVLRAWKEWRRSQDIINKENFDEIKKMLVLNLEKYWKQMDSYNE